MVYNNFVLIISKTAKYIRKYRKYYYLSRVFIHRVCVNIILCMYSYVCMLYIGTHITYRAEQPDVTRSFVTL